MPGSVSAALELCQSGGEFTTQINLVALNDGRLWRWSKSSTWSDHFDEFIFGLVGAGVGLVLGLIIVAVIRWRTRPAGSPPLRLTQVLGWILFGTGVIAVLIMIFLGTGVQFQLAVVLAVAGVIGLGGWLLITDKRSAAKEATLASKRVSE